MPVYSPTAPFKSGAGDTPMTDDQDKEEEQNLDEELTSETFDFSSEVRRR